MLCFSSKEVKVLLTVKQTNQQCLYLCAVLNFSLRLLQGESVLLDFLVFFQCCADQLYAFFNVVPQLCYVRCASFDMSATICHIHGCVLLDITS